MSIRDGSNRGSNELSKGKNHPNVVAESPLRSPRVEIAIDFMKANLHRRIPLAELAGVANLSPSHLSRLFKLQTRLSPGEYLRKLRMEKALELVAAGLLSIKEIMSAVGYKSKSHFVRDFRRSFRLAPSEYRREVSRPQSDKP
jgi:transcriptional regulator GlxA family with amidase domain